MFIRKYFNIDSTSGLMNLPTLPLSPVGIKKQILKKNIRIDGLMDGAPTVRTTVAPNQ